MLNSEEFYQLKRILGLKESVIINLGAIIGAGIFVIIGIAAGKAGPAIIISILLSSVIAIFTGLSFSEIAQHISKEFSILNILEIKNSTKTLSILVIINIIILIIFIVTGLFYFNASHFTNFFPHGFTGIMEGPALIFFAFTGFSRITTVGDEVKNPEKTIPKAIIISILISTLIYVIIAIVAIGLIPYTSLANSSAPLSSAINVLHNPYLDIIMAIGGITATAGVTLTGILGTSRVLYAMGRDDEIPEKFGYIDKYATPVYSIILSVTISIIFVYFVGFSTIIAASNVSVLTAYSIINISAIILWSKIKNDNPEHLREHKYFFIIPSFGIITILITIGYLGLLAIEISLTVLLIVALIYYIKYLLKTKGYINKISKKIPGISKVRLIGKSRNKIKK